MKIAMDRLCRVFSRALDIIEEEQIGASEYHSMRVAALCAAMGKRLGYDDDAISALATCALFHDNALTEFPISEDLMSVNGRNMILHCEKGERNVSWLPFKKNADGYILYHHERGNGKGPFCKRDGEYPFEAALIAAADSVDISFRLQDVNASDLSSMRNRIAAEAELRSTQAAITTLLDILDEDMLKKLRDENIAETLDISLPRWEASLSERTIVDIAGFIAKIIDFKSEFTSKHTSQIANRTWLMSNYYGYSNEESIALYLAASLHDVGKIAVPTDILEKPGKLDNNQFETIKQHVRYTHDWLSDIPGFDLIKDWAANHHEKLDGSGYSFQKKDIELDFNSRLMACIDIYQAVCEMRPYHDARSHEDTMPILYSMANRGSIDMKIVKDLDEVMARYSMQDVPHPFHS